jgi:hypothetical protein
MAEPAGAADAGDTAHITASTAAGAILDKAILGIPSADIRTDKENRCLGLTFDLSDIRR